MVEINWNPSPRELRRWAFAVAAALGAAGLLFRFALAGHFAAGHAMAPFMWAFGAFALATAGTGTRLGLPAYRAWMGFAWVAGTVIGTLALAFVFYGVITPLGVAARLLGRDRLRLRDPGGASGWVPLPAAPHDPERQF